VPSAVSSPGVQAATTNINKHVHRAIGRHHNADI
jgi:hypothetical protein